MSMFISCRFFLFTSSRFSSLFCRFSVPKLNFGYHDTPLCHFSMEFFCWISILFCMKQIYLNCFILQTIATVCTSQMETSERIQRKRMQISTCVWPKRKKKYPKIINDFVISKEAKEKHNSKIQKKIFLFLTRHEIFFFIFYSFTWT